MVRGVRELKFKTAYAILAGVATFAIIYGFFMFFTHGKTVQPEIEISALTFSVDDKEYKIYTSLNELLQNPAIVVENGKITESIKPGANNKVTLKVHTQSNGSHDHLIDVYVKNTSERVSTVKDSAIYKIEIDIQSIQKDMKFDACGINFFHTSIAEFVAEEKEDLWTDRFGTPDVQGSFETKKYVWEKPIKFTNSRLLIVREFGEQKHLYIEIENIDDLFKSN